MLRRHYSRKIEIGEKNLTKCRENSQSSAKPKAEMNHDQKYNIFGAFIIL